MLAELVEETVEETHGGRGAIRGFEDQGEEEKGIPKAFRGEAKGQKTRLNHANDSSGFLRGSRGKFDEWKSWQLSKVEGGAK